MGQKIEDTKKHVKTVGEIAKVVIEVATAVGLVLNVLSGNKKN